MLIEKKDQTFVSEFYLSYIIMRYILEIYPILFLTVIYFILGYFIGSIVNKYINSECIKNTSVSYLLLHIFFMLNVLVFIIYVSTFFTNTLETEIGIKKELLDVSKFIFGYALFQSQIKLRQCMDQLNNKTKLNI